MKPDGVGSGTPLVYSNDSPGSSTGVSPTTPGAAHLLQLAVRVGDLPMPGLELHRARAAVGDLDRVGPEEIAVLRRRALGQESRRDLDLDAAGGGAVHRLDSLVPRIWPIRSHSPRRGSISMLENPAPEVTIPVRWRRQDGLNTGAEEPDLQARRYMASIVQSPMIRARGPGAGRPDRTRPAARSVSRPGALADLSRSRSQQHRQPGSPSATTASATRPKSSSSSPATPRPSSTAAPWCERGFIVAGARILRRAWQIYVAHVFLFAIYIAEIAYVASSFENPLYVEEMNALDFLKTPEITIIQALLLKFKPANMDVLPLYIVLLMLFPAGAVAADAQRARWRWRPRSRSTC